MGCENFVNAPDSRFFDMPRATLLPSSQRARSRS
jgi:hypothetical protein